jgi:hypothetical protein
LLGPIRPAITVACIVGHATASSRIRGLTRSTIDPPTRPPITLRLNRRDRCVIGSAT